MFPKKLVTLFVTAVFVSQANAVDVAVVGTGNMESPKIEASGANQATSSKVGLGFGALIGFDMGKILTLETGALLINRKYSDTAGVLTTSFGRVQIPLLIKFTSLPIVSFGAGPYLELAMGDIGRENTVTTAKTSTTYDATGFDSMDIGIAASACADIPLAPLMSLVLELRYNMGLMDLDRSPTDSFKFGGLQGLAGVRFSL